MKFNKITDMFRKKERKPENTDEVVMLDPYPTDSSEQENPTQTQTPKEPKVGLVKRIVNRIWGNGPPGRYNTPENPYPPYCIRAKLKRWFYVTYRGYVYYITTMYDRPNDEYLFDYDIIPKRNIPRQATSVTNQKHTWHMDLDHPDRDFIYMEGDYGFTAHDADLFIKCNKIDEAMKIDLDAKPNTDTMKIMLIAACVGVAFMVFYMMFMQR